MINPSVGHIAGGPTKMELTGHLDCGGGALPTLLNMWQGSHYGGTELTLDQDGGVQFKESRLAPRCLPALAAHEQLRPSIYFIRILKYSGAGASNVISW